MFSSTSDDKPLPNIYVRHTGVASIIDMVCLEEPSSCSQLQEGSRQLYRAMRWCSSRQTAHDIDEGVYISTVAPVHLATFLAGLISLSAEVVLKIHDQTKLCVRGGASLLFDERLAIWAMDVAISNAVVYGAGCNSAILINASFRATDNRGFEENSNGELILSVENEVPPGVQLSNDDLQRSKEASVTLDRHNDHFKTHSTDSGLRKIYRACQSMGGSFDLCLGAERKTVLLTIRVPSKLSVSKDRVLDRATKTILTTPEKAQAEEFSMVTELKVCAVDDSKVRRCS